MQEVDKALAIVLRETARRPAERCALVPEHLGRVLATAVRADRDSPPFDKSLRDGYAVRAVDATAAPLRVVEEIPAGVLPTRTVERGTCSRIFTGAPIPAGADAVVMQEDTTAANGLVTITQAKVEPGQWIFRRGQEMRAGDAVVPEGTVLTPAAFGLLAAIGCTTADLISRPRVAVLATGDELVPAGEGPGPGQIRNSNGPMLLAQALRAGAVPRDLGIGRDDRDTLTRLIRDGLDQADVLLLAGGVSVGTYDLVPEVLKDLGVTTHFRQVRMKPGKPLLFGTLSGKLVFGLPGNPVSAFVSFELFVKPALKAMMGDPGLYPRVEERKLANGLTQRNDRPTYHPGTSEPSPQRPVRALPFGGAPDLRSLLAADVLLELPVGESRYETGDSVTVIVLN